MFKLYSNHTSDKQDKVLLFQSKDPRLVFHKYKMLLKYKKYICNSCPKTKSQRLLLRNIERKIIRELQFQSPPYPFHFLYNCDLCIMHRDLYYSFTPFTIKFVLIPKDELEAFKHESYLISYFFKNIVWINTLNYPSFKYHSVFFKH